MESKICDTSDSFFSAYTSLPGNTACLDCSSPAPQWASVTYGILICMTCTTQHRSLGVSVSQVRSINLDLWTEKHISMMQQGGNIQFKEYMEKYNLEGEELRMKYQTKAAQFYRRKIATLSSGA